MKRFLTLISLLGMLGFAGMTASVPAFAQEAAPAAAAPEAPAAAPAVLDTGSTAWMITATVLVILMTIPGLALYYGGLVRSKNVLSVLAQVFVTFSLLAIIWALYAYSIAFGTADSATVNNVFGGFGKAFLSGVTPDSLQGTIPEYVFFTFQLTFAAITPALIIGGFAERIKFSAVLVFMVLWLSFCYAPIAHMVWGGGWLGTLGAKDFAGGTVVHINAGIAGLIGALVIGKRVGYGKESLPPHNLVLTMIGASLLWVGWYGFNVGSELAVDGTAALVLVNTTLATSAAALGWLFAEWIFKGKPTILGATSGAVAGLVAITPACGFIGPMGSIVLGIIAGVACLWAVTGLKKLFGYDDSLDVWGVHGIGGIIGALGTGVLMDASLGGVGFPDGVTLGGQVLKQAIAVGTTLVWTGVITYIIYKVVDITIGLRVPEDKEREGLDTASHGEIAYHS